MVYLRTFSGFEALTYESPMKNGPTTRHMCAVVVDPVAIGIEHVQFNAELLKALRQSGSFAEFRFFAGREHRKAVLETVLGP
jgi:hypothetical protein